MASPDTLVKAAWLAGCFAVNFAVTYAIARRRRIRGWELLLGLVPIIGPLYLSTFLPPEDSMGSRERLRFRLQNRFKRYEWLLAFLTFAMFGWAIVGGLGMLAALLVVLINHPVVFNGQETNHLAPKLITFLMSLCFLYVGVFYLRKVRPRVRSLARSGWPEAIDTR